VERGGSRLYVFFIAARKNVWEGRMERKGKAGAGRAAPVAILPQYIVRIVVKNTIHPP